MRLKPKGNKVRLADLEPGTLFLFGNDCLALKSEYISKSGRIEAYIVDTGEMFHGGAKSVGEHYDLMVQPLKIEPVVMCKECKYCRQFKGLGNWCHRRLRSGIEFKVKLTDYCSYGKRRANG